MSETKILMVGEAMIQTAELDERGKPKAWKEWGKAVKDSFKLNTSQGEITELKTEGGSVEATKQSPNTYAVEFEIRMGHTTELPVSFVDGVSQGFFTMRVKGENPKAKGLRIDRCTLSLVDSADMNEGYKVKITAKALRPEAGNTIKYEHIDFAATNSLQVILLGDGGNGGWRLAGESNWRASAETAYINGTGSKTIEYKAVDGKTAPAEPTVTSITITAGENAIVAKYK